MFKVGGIFPSKFFFVVFLIFSVDNTYVLYSNCNQNITFDRQHLLIINVISLSPLNPGTWHIVFVTYTQTTYSYGC